MSLYVYLHSSSLFPTTGAISSTSKRHKTPILYNFDRLFDPAECQDDRHWDMQERRLFGENHVVAGINFNKYDNIEALPALGNGLQYIYCSMYIPRGPC